MISTVGQVEGVALDITRIAYKATTTAIPERLSVTGRSFAAREGGFTSFFTGAKSALRIVS
jgi:hypothetical protein